MNYNKYINSFADTNEYNSYIESDKAYSPNIGFIEETKQVKWIENVMRDCIFYGTTEATTDFMIGSSVRYGNDDCINVHVVPLTDGSDNIMYAAKNDIVKTPVRIHINQEITSIKKWKIDTSNVTDMSYMFYMRHLKSLDLSSFDTSNVTNMYAMFVSCNPLTSLDLSSFNTSKVTNMAWMFRFNFRLASLDISNFDTSKVTNMEFMFHMCGLTSLDVSSFDTSKVTNMGGMFDDCSSLTSLKLSSSFFNSSTVKEFDFSGLTSWTETTSLSQFVNAISSKNGAGKTVKLSNATKNALTDAQKNSITSKGWTIA